MPGNLGFGDCEMSWILEDNVLMNRSLEVMGAKRYKTIESTIGTEDHARID